MAHCHICTAPIQRSHGDSAKRRFDYQTCKRAYRAFAEYHCGGAVLLPKGAPARFANFQEFRQAVVTRERRWDAQEGRKLDFSLPREVPREMLLPLSAFVIAPLVKMGMAARLDIECPPASDGGSNPHAHGYLAQRSLGAKGFGLKEQDWNRYFRRDQCRHVRAVIAGRITLGCAVLGIEGVQVDPRRCDEIGAGPAEPRLLNSHFRRSEGGEAVQELEDLKALRRAKCAIDVVDAARFAHGRNLEVRSAVAYPGDKRRAARARETLLGTAREVGIDLDISPTGKSSPERLAVAGTSIVFDGEAIGLDGDCNQQEAQIVAQLALLMDWPALVVEGDPQPADMVMIAAADRGLAAINRAPSADAVAAISKSHFESFKSEVARYDTLGITAQALLDCVPVVASETKGAMDSLHSALHDNSTEGAMQTSLLVASDPALTRRSGFPTDDLMKPTLLTDADRNRKSQKHALKDFVNSGIRSTFPPAEPAPSFQRGLGLAIEPPKAAEDDAVPSEEPDRLGDMGRSGVSRSGTLRAIGHFMKNGIRLTFLPSAGSHSSVGHWLRPQQQRSQVAGPAEACSPHKSSATKSDSAGLRMAPSQQVEPASGCASYRPPPDPVVDEQNEYDGPSFL